MQEKRFSKAVGELIALRFVEEWATSDDDGIRVKPGVEENDPAQVLSWTPACEMEGWPDSPEAITYPALPYPFTAKELAAFLLAGVGSMVAEYYGDFSGGPDEDKLKALGIKAAHARDALKQAYTEIRLAIAEVGEIDQQLQQKAHDLRHQFDEANLEANRRERLWEPGISEDERRVRREKARQSVEELEREATLVSRDADSALKRWNAAMVKALLYPVPDLTDAAAPPYAFCEPAPATTIETRQVASVVAGSACTVPTWTVRKPQRFNGYTAPLFRLLQAAHRDGQSCPTARDVLEVWRNNMPAEIAKVLPDSFDYYDTNGDTKPANVDAIRKAIKRMTTAR